MSESDRKYFPRSFHEEKWRILIESWFLYQIWARYLSNCGIALNSWATIVECCAWVTKSKFMSGENACQQVWSSHGKNMQILWRSESNSLFHWQLRHYIVNFIPLTIILIHRSCSLSHLEDTARSRRFAYDQEEISKLVSALETQDEELLADTHAKR